MKTIAKHLELKNIQYRIITSKNQSNMIQIFRVNKSYDLCKIIEKEGYKITDIDSTSLIYKN